MRRIEILGETLNIKLSPSFMVKAACPFYLKCQYVDKLDDRYIRVAAERGKAAHQAIDEILNYCLDNEIPPSEISDGMTRDALERHSSHGILGEILDVFKWVRKWKENFPLPAHVIGVEQKIALDTDYDEVDFSDASYRGILDLLQIRGNHAIVTDWKSQPNILSQTDMDAHEQGTMYCWLVQKLYPHVEKFTFRIWFLRYGFYKETFRTESDLEEFEQALIIKERKIEQINNWDPIPGPQCQYCDFIHRCPIAQDLSPISSEIIDQKQAVIAAQKITVMSSLIGELKAKLKEYVKKNDEILIGDNWIYGYQTSNSKSYPPEALGRVLDEHGHELAEYVNTDSTKMKKLLKEAARENEELRASLDLIAETKTKTTFKGYKRKDPPPE